MKITPKAKVLRITFLVSLTLTIITNPSEAGGLLSHTAHLTIINGLRPDLNLTAHCKSKDTDLGAKVVPYWGNFSFHFRPNYFGRTLFFCRMEWKDSTALYFDIYKGERDYLNCKCYHYLWQIFPQGPCMFNRDTSKFDFCYEWNKP